MINKTGTLLVFICSIFLSAYCRSGKVKLPGPQIDDVQQECRMVDGSAGTCLNYKNCLSAQTSKEDPQTCFFEGSEYFVCCRNNLDEVKRISFKACEHNYRKVQFIVGGTAAAYNEFYYMVALGWSTNFGDKKYVYNCGGVLISPIFVLTAAHCASYNGLPPEIILPGGVNLTDNAERIFKIDQVISHPNYSATTSYNDIALLRLKEPVLYHNIACLWQSYALANDTVTAIGYGQTTFAGLSSDQLLKATLKLVSNKKCDKFYKPPEFSRITNGQLCARDSKGISDTCQGDSGGPLILQSVVNSFRIVPNVVAITSYGQTCAGDVPGVYTRVSEYLDWIEPIVWPGDKLFNASKYFPIKYDSVKEQ